MLMDDDENQNCLTCSHLEGKRRSQTPIFVANPDNSFENSPGTTRKTLLFKKQTFTVGSAVMLLPDTFSKFFLLTRLNTLQSKLPDNNTNTYQCQRTLRSKYNPENP